MVCSVSFVISEEEDAALGPGTRLDHSRGLGSNIKVWKGAEKASDIDIRRGTESVPLASLLWREVAQSCPTLCNPIDCSLPGSSIHRVLQARVLEWVAISFSRSSQPRDWTRVSHIVDALRSEPPGKSYTKHYQLCIRMGCFSSVENSSTSRVIFRGVLKNDPYIGNKAGLKPFQILICIVNNLILKSYQNSSSGDAKLL